MLPSYITEKGLLNYQETTIALIDPATSDASHYPSPVLTDLSSNPLD